MSQFHSCSQSADEVLEQFAEIHPAIGGKVENDLAAVVKVFHIHQIHCQIMSRNPLHAVALGILLEFEIFKMLLNFFLQCQMIYLFDLRGVHAGDL